MDINFKNVSFVYGEKTPFEKLALDNIDLTIKPWSILMVENKTIVFGI